MPEIDSTKIVYFLAFVVPGFISMQIYGQICPRQRLTLKDSLLEAISFGTINFALLFFAIRWVVEPSNFIQYPFRVWLTAISVFLVVPSLSPWLLVLLQRLLAKWNLFLSTAPTAWDHYFQRRRVCWIIVHINETRMVGGRFGPNSYASSYPEPGHLYIEELWELDANGGFIQKSPQSGGIILRPSDYQMVEFFTD